MVSKKAGRVLIALSLVGIPHVVAYNEYDSAAMDEAEVASAMVTSDASEEDIRPRMKAKQAKQGKSALNHRNATMDHHSNFEAWQGVAMHNHQEIMFFQSAQDQAITGAPKSPRGLPKPMATGRSFFTITAHNPGGKRRSVEENRRENDGLWEGALEDMYGQFTLMMMWHNRAFNLRQNKIEDGYVLAFPMDRQDEAREYLVYHATTLGQSVIYEFYMLEDKMYRKTIPCADETKEELVEEFVRVTHAEGFDRGEKFLHYHLEKVEKLKAAEPNYQRFEEEHCGAFDKSECKLPEFEIPETASELEEREVAELVARQEMMRLNEEARGFQEYRDELAKEEAARGAFDPAENARFAGMDPEEYNMAVREGRIVDT